MDLKGVCKLLAITIVMIYITIVLAICFLGPHRRGDIHLNFGKGNAQVYYDNQAIPHIKADTPELGAFALGYTHAVDRLWQMEYMRRVAQGKLSEVFGSAALKIDKAMRTLGLRHSCQNRENNFYSDNAYKYANAYAQGINEYPKNHILPIQYQLFWLDFEEWTIEDSCTIVKLMQFFLNHNWGIEIARDYVDAFANDPELVGKLFPFEREEYKDFSTTIITDLELMRNGLFKNNTNFKHPKHSRGSNRGDYDNPFVKEIKEAFDIGNTQSVGSNGWAISGNFTKSGKPIFANDPHLGNKAPSTWHLSKIILPNGRYISGATLPGFPLHIIYKTDRISAGITSVWSDNSDVYEERIHREMYEYMGELYPLEIRNETIKIKGEPEVTHLVKSTRNGPLVSNDIHTFGLFCENIFPIHVKGNLSLRWVGHAEKNYTSFTDFYNVMFSNNVVEALELIKNSKGFTANIMLADVEGHIAFAPSGSHAKRKSLKFGQKISRGWTDENEWIGIVNPDEKPYLLDPKKGFIVAANNPISTPNMEAPISAYSASTARSYRITVMIQDLIKTKGGQIEIDDMFPILSDTKDVYAEFKIKHMVDAVYKHIQGSDKKMHKHNTKDLQKYLNMLKKWNFQFDENAIEPTYFTYWEYMIMRNIFKDEIADYDNKMKFLSHFLADRFFMNFYKELANDQYYKKNWCQSYNSRSIDSCVELMVLAFEDTIYNLNVESQKRSLEWGSFHQIHYENIPFTRTPFRIFYDKYIPASGSINTVKMTMGKHLTYDAHKHFNSVVSQNLKMVVDFGGEQYISIDTGQSEHVWSHNYFDMNARHHNDKLFQMMSDEELAEMEKYGASIYIYGNDDPHVKIKSEDL